MQKIETDWEGIKLKGIVVFRDEWCYEVRLVEPIESWKSGSHIPTFARGTARENYSGTYGDSEMRKTLIELYQKADKLYRLIPRLQIVYKDYCEEIALLDSTPPSKARERIRNKITDTFMDFIFGEGKWTVSDRDGALEILNSSDKFISIK